MAASGYAKAPAMTLARKIILHAPVSDAALLPAFVEQCLRDHVSLLAIVGPGSRELEDAVDWLVVGDGENPERFLCTSSHPDEPIEDVINMVASWEYERRDPYAEIRL